MLLMGLRLSEANARRITHPAAGPLVLDSRLAALVI
jgi:hypothetical protein